MTALREPTYFILAALLDEPRHGYGIIQRVNELSRQRVKLAAGTLYGALDRLQDEGLIVSSGEEIVEGRTRRYYHLTEDGVSVVSAEAERLAQAAKAVTKMLSQPNATFPAIQLRPA